MEKLAITILNMCQRSYATIKVGTVLTLVKDTNNHFDDEAIEVLDGDEEEVGFVANSVSTVIRGTYSAGRIYDKIDDHQKVVVKYVHHNSKVIAEIEWTDQKLQKDHEQ
ncbi:hypothetical protein A4S06_01450 [Erysipelotrichaceae bacterium MTC7]|nr:hypothetical protein A4S06_01450 [Erysipelotrichaceae bacterium MTC7]